MKTVTMKVRTAERHEIDALATLWYESWQDAHAKILPAELARVRTLENLRERLGELWTDLRVIGDVGRPDLIGSKGFTAEQMGGMLYDSLREKILPLPDETEIYPAHGAGSLCGKSLSKETWSTACTCASLLR